MITVVGLGPSTLDLLTLEAYKILKENHVYLRTAVHPAVEEFKTEEIEFSSFDYLYEDAEDFDTVYKKIAEKLAELSKERDIVYAVPGNPAFYEMSVKNIINLVGEENVKIVPGVSFIDIVADSIAEEFDENFCVIDAYNFSQENFSYPIKRSVIVPQVYDRFLLSTVKLKLLEYLPDDYQVAVITYSNAQNVEWINLYELDHREGNHLMSLYIPSYDNLKYSFNDLVLTIKKLREPDGCPWDREQTHESLKRYAIEEAAEVVDAIERNDIDNLLEELGDLLLQVILHSQIATENNEFDVGDVINSITEKMIRRHPHVFETENLVSAQKVIDQWESIKMVEKHTEFISEEMKNLPLSMSALLKSDKIQDKARTVGFDWDDPREAIRKVSEEREEVIQALESGNRDNLIEEIGDLIFAVVNVSRLCKIDPEEALRLSNQKFINRFEKMESFAKDKNKTLLDYDLNELEDLWLLAKENN